MSLPNMQSHGLKKKHTYNLCRLSVENPIVFENT